MFLKKLNRKNKKVIKRIYFAWCTYKNICQSDENHLKAFMHYLKDLKNNPNFESWFMNYANNNSSILRGCSLNLVKNNHRFY